MDSSKDNMSFIDRWFLESSESTPNELDLQLLSLTADENPPLADHQAGLNAEPSSSMPSSFVNDVPLHHPPCVGGLIPEPHYPLDYWLPHDRVYLFPNDLMSANLHQQHYNGFDDHQPNYDLMSENLHQQHCNGFDHQFNYDFSPVFPPMASSDHSIQMPQQVSSVSNDNAAFIPQIMQESSVESGDCIIIGESVNGHVHKRTGTVLPDASPQSKEKKPRTTRKDKPAPAESSSRSAVPKKTTVVEINGISMDISGIPIPFCTCTGTPRHCYRWGSGGWQSSCCTNSLSSFPLPVSTKKQGTRISGRKMSLGGFKKVLEKLASEGYDFSVPIDLRTCWAKHGTNKFVTIR